MTHATLAAHEVIGLLAAERSPSGTPSRSIAARHEAVLMASATATPAPSPSVSRFVDHAPVRLARLPALMAPPADRVAVRGGSFYQSGLTTEFVTARRSAYDFGSVCAEDLAGGLRCV